MKRKFWPWSGALILVLLSQPAANAVPYFARKYNTNCVQCHALPPMLNEFGQRFVANGYRLPELKKAEGFTIPAAIWSSYRVDADHERDWAKGYPNRVEMISSDSINSWLGYFVEWRTLSYGAGSNGRLSGRHGRFEDLFVQFTLPKKVFITAGQFRMINQYDVSRRLTLAEPTAFSAGVPGVSSPNSRLTALRSFSFAGRAPAVRATWIARPGRIESDGWFHEFTVPMSGEFAIPLGDEAKRTASFQLEGRPKGFLYETYYRKSLNSIGGALFAGTDRWAANATGTLRLKDHYLLASAGTAKFRTGLHDFRLSVGDDWVFKRWVSLGARLDHQTALRRRPAVLPHMNFSVPGGKYTFLVAIEQRLQQRNMGTSMEFSVVF